MLEHRHPDVVLVLKEKRFLYLLEMACAFDSLVEEREKEKADKYEKLAADMAVHQPGYRVRAVPIVMVPLEAGKVTPDLKHLQPLTTKHSLECHAVGGALFEHQDFEMAPCRMSLAYSFRCRCLSSSVSGGGKLLALVVSNPELCERFYGSFFLLLWPR